MTRRAPLIFGTVLGSMLLTLTAGLAGGQVFGSSSASRVEELASGDAVRDIRADRGEELHFRVYVPADADVLEIRTSGGRGDADLYIRHGELPGKAAYDGRSSGSSSTEHVEIRRPREGWWYITLRAFSDFRDVDMRVQHDGRGDQAEPGQDVLHDGEQVRRLRGQAGEMIGFRLDVPHYAERLQLRMDGGRGDADLYLSRRHEPSPKDYEHRSVGRTTREAIDIRRPAAGTWYLTIYAYRDFEGAELRVDIDGGRYDDDDDYLRNGLELLRPQRRTVWLLGGTERVSWQADRDVREVQIQFSLDDGRTWQRDGLPHSIDADRGEYFVKLPTGSRWASNRARIRIVDVENPRRFAVSEAFRIVDGRHDDDHRDDDGDRYEDDDRLARASRIVLGEAQQRTINPEEDEDYILFVPPQRATYVATFAHVSEELDVEVIRIDNRRREQTLEEFRVDREGAEAVFVTDLRTRGIVFRVRARDDDETGRYVLLVQRQVQQPGRPAPLPRPRPNPAPGANVTTLRGDAEKVENLAGREGSVRRFKVHVPRGTDKLSVHTEDGRGRIDLYVERGELASRKATWRSRRDSTEQTVNITRPQPGWYHITIYGRENYNGVEIAAWVKQ